METDYNVITKSRWRKDERNRQIGVEDLKILTPPAAWVLASKPGLRATVSYDRDSATYEAA